MNPNHPEQRAVGCRVLTEAGWLEGVLHLPQKAQLCDFLNRGEPLFRLTEAVLPGRRERVPFFALNRSAVIAVAPISPEERPAVELAPRRAHGVELLLRGGATVTGEVDVLANTRVSDYLMRHTGFIPLTRVAFRAGNPGASLATAAEFPLLLLQASSAIGVTEASEG